ncbi:hypothetical protein CHS0354_010250 [Potamilus streckersoni]|uniref:Epithelial cell-transforming sequence 2 oncogene-like n=1 Tax=Potamilus streckersoni TaxID=2493646 RepID=A0AAE0RSP8_9BIVA|nr:hypothetical protein CHS0354_010250 [Potamilus streckersoni]
MSMAVLDQNMETRHPTGRKMKSDKLSMLTHNDTKVLGRVTSMRKEKVTQSHRFDTLKMKTSNSAWTPMTNRPSNEQIFSERTDLVSHWFDLWSNSQRKRFLDRIFCHCSKSQYGFVQEWFENNVPFQHLDFTRVLPRFLSLYIFSFLEPISLCQAAQVCWNWKFLAEQDVIWKSKCIRKGWFIPYEPIDNEYGGWKNFYAACVHVIVNPIERDEAMYGYSKRNLELQGTEIGSPRNKPSRSQSARLTRMESNTLRTSRPPWQSPNYHPKDLDKNHYAFLHDFNPNDPNIPKAVLLFHNKWGILKKNLHDDHLSKSQDFELGLDTKRRRDQHRALTSGDVLDMLKTRRTMTMTEYLEVESMHEKRLKTLVGASWEPPERAKSKRLELSSYPRTVVPLAAGATPGGQALDFENPRIIFISSRVPASELLHDAVMFGVLPIVYEYEGTTIETLRMRLEQVLKGRNAQSIGLFCHYEEPGEIRLVRNCSVTLDTFDLVEVREFFKVITSHIRPVEQGGQLDIFMPLAASEPGMELIVQLSVLTGMQISSPTGIIGNYNHVNTEWLIPYSDGSPPEKYFCTSKLDVWANVADQALEAIKSCRNHLSVFFDKVHGDVVAQLAGQVVFDVLGQANIHGVHKITTYLTDGLRLLGEQNNVNPLEFLGQYLLEQAGVRDLQFTGTKQYAESQKSPLEEEDGVNRRQENKDSEEKRREKLEAESDAEEEEEEEEAKEEEDGMEKEELERREMEWRSQKKQVVLKTQELSKRFGSMRLTGRYEKLSPKRFSDHPEKRSPIAMEILTTEIEYNRILTAIKKIYFKPLRDALESNRAIISFQNVQIIFTDVMAILQLSKELTKDLKNRIAEWDSENSCLGDIFVKFCSHLKVYTNFANNYEVILRCIERCKEQSPLFRAFLKRHDRIPETKMLTLQDMLLIPPRRVNQYVTLLRWFELHTSKTHPDRADLTSATEILTELDHCIRECQLRLERDRELVALQKRILNCPALLEANRYLIKQLDVCCMKPPADSIKPEEQVYQHVAMYGLFLFNDSLVITRRTSKNFPYSRAVEYTYKFESCVGLTKLRVHDIPKSKYLPHGFRIECARQDWYCAAETEEDKFNWISQLEQSIRAALRWR